MSSRDAVSMALLATTAGLLGLAGLAAAALAGYTAITARRVEKALPPQGRFVAVDGVPVHVVEAGSGPAIVMIHGLGGQTRNFSFGVSGPLSETHRVVLLDRPGSGYSPRAASAPAGLAAQAHTIAGLIRTLGLHKPLLVGHSLGGAIALAVALDHPDCVGGLALIAPVTHPMSAPPEPFRGIAIRSRLLRRLAGWTIATPLAIQHSQQTMDWLFGPDPVDPSFAFKGGGLLSLRPSNFYAASSDLIEAGTDLAGMVARYPSLQMPVGILYGTGDRILDHADHGTALQALIAGSELELVEAGGHMLPISAPQRVVAFIEHVAQRMGEVQAA